MKIPSHLCIYAAPGVYRHSFHKCLVNFRNIFRQMQTKNVCCTRSIDKVFETYLNYQRKRLGAENGVRFSRGRKYICVKYLNEFFFLGNTSLNNTYVMEWFFIFIPLYCIELNFLLHYYVKYCNKSQFTCKINCSGFHFIEFNRIFFAV